LNATVFGANVDKKVDKYGNDMVYYPPRTPPTYDSEGDWIETKYQTTSIAAKWIEPNMIDMNEFSEMGVYNLKDNEAIIKNSLNVVKRGKIVSNGVSWEVYKINQIRIKESLVLNTVICKNIV
jgi:hypothetical protein